MPTPAEPPPANSPTMHSSQVCQDSHFCLEETAYLPYNPQKKFKTSQKKGFLVLPSDRISENIVPERH